MITLFSHETMSINMIIGGVNCETSCYHCFVSASTLTLLAIIITN